ncbi:hypothetical protein LIER_19491 [Lithospermum erythrorhizon]|uniref:G-patch domain-containing protein n=1 Tax=Lithospermum erythrorhizon TaxID=34254 RepID=A0AAV3QIT5_LITER
MAGGRSKKKLTKPKSQNRRASRGQSSSRALFIKGGILDDFDHPNSPPSRGRKPSVGYGHGSENRSGNGKGKVGSNSKSDSARNVKGFQIGFVYPSTDGQRGPIADNAEEENSLKNLQPMILLKSGETSIVAYVDEGPFKSAQTAEYTTQAVEYTCDYNTSFVLGDGSHRGLGFNDEAEQCGSAVGPSSFKDDKGACSFEQSSSEEDMYADMGPQTGLSESDDELLDETSSVEENQGFLSIGGMRIYTQDISDGEDDEEEVLDGEPSGSSDSEGSTGSSESDDSSYGGSDIDEDVAADYFEGIGGSGKIVNVDQLIGQMSDVSDDNLMERTSTRALEEKLGGIALQDASREYGMEKNMSRRKYNVKDDLMFVKDPRILSGRKKYSSSYPKYSPSEAKKSKRSRRFPGEKKKKHKETVAVKRRERMILRGVDPKKINSKLEKIVLDGVDIFSFQPMHPRDCTQVQRLAAIYRLRSGCQNSGKKRFVTVVRTQHTCMPSPNDRIRLEKLIGANDVNADFTVNDVSLRGKTTYKKASRDCSSTLLKKSTKSRNDSSKKKSNKIGSYAAQPVSFVSCGIMDSAIVELKTNESPDTSDSSHGKGASSSVEFGSFELHTTGFGSKMMAKMGYVEGGGLGKDGQGIAKPVEVSQRPKSLGLGAEVPEASSNSAKKEYHSSGPDKPSTRHKVNKEPSTRQKVIRESQSFGAFEQHTRGFGSKMMARMGFVEGTGLGRDSQGIVKPLEASRRPKGQGLGSSSRH